MNELIWKIRYTMRLKLNLNDSLFDCFIDSCEALRDVGISECPLSAADEEISLVK